MARQASDLKQTETAPFVTALGHNNAAMRYWGTMGLQMRALREGVEILVVCPGRLLDHIGQGNTALKGVEILSYGLAFQYIGIEIAIMAFVRTKRDMNINAGQRFLIYNFRL